MHQRSWRTLIAGGAALAVGVTLTAFGAPAHAAGVPGITSEARAQDEVMNYAVNLTDDASRYDFNAAVSKASENGVVLAQYPEFNTFFVQSVKAAFAPTLGKSLVDAGISYQSIGPTRYKTVTGSEVRTEQPQTTASEANAVADAAGTHVAGTIAAAHKAYGVDGVAPSVTIVAIKTSNEAGSFYPEYVAWVFDWAAEHDIDVTNSSYYMDPYAFWMPTEGSQAAGLEAASHAIRYAKNHGVVNIVAEGNDNDDHDNPTIDKASPNDVEGAAVERNVVGDIDVPAMVNDSVVSVAAVALPTGTDPATATLERSKFSNYGKNSVDVAAPGSRIWSTLPTWKKDPPFGYLSGTSMASPHAAGVAALIKQIHPDYTPDQTIALLKKQAGYTYDCLAVPEDGKEYRGAGLVNALAAVLKDQPQPVVGNLEYSHDGATDWRPLADARVSGTVYVRTTVSGPVTAASLQVADKEPVTGTGAFTGNEVTLVAGLYVAADLVGDGPHVDVTVSAEGRNKDSRADDDVKDTIHSHVDESLHDGGAWGNSTDGWKYCYTDGYCARSKYVTIDGDTYYFNGDAVMATGWATFDGAWHWMTPSGRMAKGWANAGGTWYYLDASGKMVTGWVTIDGTRYHFASSGAWLG